MRKTGETWRKRHRVEAQAPLPREKRSGLARKGKARTSNLVRCLSESAKERSAPGGFPGNGPVIDPAMGLRPGLHEIRTTRKTLAIKPPSGD